MFVKLTNSSPEFLGHSIVIKKDLIVTVYGGDALRPEGTTEKVTFVFAPPHGTWEVQETVEQVFKLLK